MIRLFVLLTCMWFCLLVSSARSGPLVGADAPMPVPALPSTIAGIPYHEARTILGRHLEKLRQLPGVTDVHGLGIDGIYIYTDKPEMLPAEVEGLPVKALPPPHQTEPLSAEGTQPSGSPQQASPLSQPPQDRQLPPIAGKPYEEAQAVAKRHEAELMRLPGVYFVGVGENGIIVGVFVHSKDRNIPTDVLEKAIAPIPQEIEELPTDIRPLAVLPPPPGVIILRGGGSRERADSCPATFREEIVFSWRFCLAPGFPGPIPALMEPPIAGISFEEAQKIFERHQEELGQLPGVQSVWLGAEGIEVRTTNPAVVPSQIESLPVKAVLPTGTLQGANHSQTNRIRPLHGGAAGGDFSFGTLTSVGLSQGKPWLIFPAHLLPTCSQPSPCPPGSTAALNNCPHNVVVTGTRQFIQPPFGSLAQQVGLAQRWDPLQAGVDTNDVAAAFMDIDNVDGNGSISADRRLEMFDRSFTGIERQPMRNEAVFVVTQFLPHQFTALATNFGSANVIFACRGNNTPVRLINQMELQAEIGQFFEEGDSGATVVDTAGRIAGMVNWRNTQNAVIGGGTLAFAVRQRLGFDAWYGTQTVQDRTIGVFRPGSHQWILDNGNARMDACGTDLRFNDTCLGLFGSTGEHPVVGNWTGRGVYTAGQYRIGTFIPSINQWLLDANGNGSFNNDCFSPGGDWCPFLGISQPTDIGVVGDWNGDGKITIGQFRPSTAQWFLDWNGNGVWDGCSTDRCYTFGAPNDQPVVGDWNGNGRTKIGVFRNGQWFLDVTGNGIFGAGDRTTTLGISGDTPVVGHWSGLGVSQIGIFRFENGLGLWGLDADNSGTFTNCADDMCYLYGVPGDLPVTWRPSIIRAN